MTDATDTDATGTDTDDATPTADASRTISPDATDRARREPTADRAALEREGDVAADYLEALLDIADADGDIDMDVENDRATVSVVGSDLGRFVGPSGEVVEALQELTRLAVTQRTGTRSRLMLDIGGYRARRRSELTNLGRRVAESVRDRGQPRALDPMTPFERKIVHDAVAAVTGVRSGSEGVEPQRHVVVSPVSD